MIFTIEVIRMYSSESSKIGMRFGFVGVNSNLIASLYSSVRKSSITNISIIPSFVIESGGSCSKSEAP